VRVAIMPKLSHLSCTRWPWNHRSVPLSRI